MADNPHADTKMSPVQTSFTTREEGITVRQRCEIPFPSLKKVRIGTQFVLTLCVALFELSSIEFDGSRMIN
jgi:hypothetical protein